MGQNQIVPGFSPRAGEISQRKPRSSTTRTNENERAAQFSNCFLQMAEIFRHSHFWGNLFNLNDCTVNPAHVGLGEIFNFKIKTRPPGFG